MPTTTTTALNVRISGNGGSDPSDWIPLIAVLITAAVSFLVVWLTGHQQRRRQLRDDARAACAHALTAGRAVMLAILGLRSFRDDDHSADPSKLAPARREGSEKVAVALADLYAASAEIDVVASSKLMDAADGWRDQLVQLARLENEPGERDEEAWSARLEEAVIAEERFVAAVRQQLGTDSGLGPVVHRFGSRTGHRASS